MPLGPATDGGGVIAGKTPGARARPSGHDAPKWPAPGIAFSGWRAAELGVARGMVLRRLAALPADPGLPRFGLVLCDGSGTLTFRRPIPGFALPRFGGACPVWPLFEALQQPGRPCGGLLETTARPPQRFLAFALAEPRGPARFAAHPAWEAAMLLTPATPAVLGPGAPGTAANGCCRCGPRTDGFEERTVQRKMLGFPAMDAGPAWGGCGRAGVFGSGGPKLCAGCLSCRYCSNLSLNPRRSSGTGRRQSPFRTGFSPSKASPQPLAPRQTSPTDVIRHLRPPRPPQQSSSPYAR